MQLDAARTLADRLIRKHLPRYSWRFVRDYGYAGRCFCDRNLIELNEYAVLQFTEEEVRQVILHEIAHGLVNSCGRSKSGGHDRRWLSAARKIGYTGGRYCRPFKAPLAFELSASMVFVIALVTYSLWAAFGLTAGLPAVIVAVVFLITRVKRKMTPTEKLIPTEWKRYK